MDKLYIDLGRGHVGVFCKIMFYFLFCLIVMRAQNTMICTIFSIVLGCNLVSFYVIIVQRCCTANFRIFFSLIKN